MKKLHTQRYGKCMMTAVLVGLLVALGLSAFAKSPTPKVKSSGMVTVTGTVFNDDGKPVYGIRGVATLLGADGRTAADENGTNIDSSGRRIGNQWTSGNGGKFVIRLMPGTYEVYASGARKYSFNLAVPTDKSSISIEVRSGLPGFTKVRVLVHGTAVSLAGKPLPNVKGVCQDQNSGRLGPEWKSGKDGRFLVKLIPGTYKIWAYGTQTKAVTFVARAGDNEASVNVLSSPHNGLLVKFESPEGKALSNAEIGCGEAGGTGSLRTDVNGYYIYRSYGNVPFHRFFVLRGVGYADLNVTSEEVLYGDDPVVVRLNSGAFVSGRVVSEDGVPLGGVPVFPGRMGYEGDPWSWWNAQFGFKSFSHTMREQSMSISHDNDGAFSLGPLPPGDYSLAIGLPGIAYMFPSTDLIKTTSKEVNLASGKNLDGLELRVPLNKPVYSLHGRILKRDKTPLASKEIMVEVSGDYTPADGPEEWYVWEPVTRTVVTDAQGNYRLYPLRPGKYKLVAGWKGLKATNIVSIHSDKMTSDFVLK